VYTKNAHKYYIKTHKKTIKEKSQGKGGKRYLIKESAI
jgi:hypothetical protein